MWGKWARCLAWEEEFLSDGAAKEAEPSHTTISEDIDATKQTQTSEEKDAEPEPEPTQGSGTETGSERTSGTSVVLNGRSKLVVGSGWNKGEITLKEKGDGKPKLFTRKDDYLDVRVELRDWNSFVCVDEQRQVGLLRVTCQRSRMFALCMRCQCSDVSDDICMILFA